ncbi:MAG: squalene/phytoene synthase family protein [Dokdonella sp.]
MELDETRRALDSFIAKWIAAEPELGIALNFLPPSQRASEAAFTCLSRELAHACFAIREGDVAVAKLGWWNEELLRSQQGEPRHPLTQTLASHPDLTRIPAKLWQSVIAAALQQRERDPPADFDGQIAGFEQLFRPLADIEAMLFGSRDAVATARVGALAHTLREVAGVARVLENGHVALPLDSLARHRLRRDQLAVDSPERRRAAAEQLHAIVTAFDELAQSDPRLALINQASLLADRMRARKASRAGDPVAELARQLPKLSMTSTWKIWRAARAARF